MNTRKFVYIVDDDAEVRGGLVALLSTVSIPTREFESGIEFLQLLRRNFHGCVLLDVRMPDMSGIEVCEQLRLRESDLRVILMSGYADVPMVIRGMKAGAVDFVEKPFNPQDLLDRIHEALALDPGRPATDQPGAEILRRLETLARREREVLDLILIGKLNKQIADELGIGLRTVESHRAQIMQKMGCSHVVDLFRSATFLIDPAQLRDAGDYPHLARNTRSRSHH